MKRIDIVDIKNKVNKQELNFFLKNGYIYCEDKISHELVIVGGYTETNIKPNGITIISKGVKQPIGWTLNK